MRSHCRCASSWRRCMGGLLGETSHRARWDRCYCMREPFVKQCLERVWESVELRWQRLGRPGNRPLWDETTLAVGQAVARGEASVKVTPAEGLSPLDAV